MEFRTNPENKPHISEIILRICKHRVLIKSGKISHTSDIILSINMEFLYNPENKPLCYQVKFL